MQKEDGSHKAYQMTTATTSKTTMVRRRCKRTWSCISPLLSAVSGRIKLSSILHPRHLSMFPSPKTAHGSLLLSHIIIPQSLQIEDPLSSQIASSELGGTRERDFSSWSMVGACFGLRDSFGWGKCLLIFSGVWFVMCCVCACTHTRTRCMWGTQIHVAHVGPVACVAARSKKNTVV